MAASDISRRRLLALLREGLRKGRCQRMEGPIPYIRFTGASGGLERGSVVCRQGERIVHGYPKIKRIYALAKGLERNLGSGTIYIEEKIDGFNARIASIDGEIYGFSRGGFLDLFLTEKAREMDLRGFFQENPGHVIFGEMVGNTPYTSPEKGFDVKLFVFDIGRSDGSFLPCQERYEMVRRHALEGVPVLGRFQAEDARKISSLAIKLEKGGKEGMVMKSPDRSKCIKHVTAGSDIRDVAEASDILFDMPIGFYYQRILRSAFFVQELALERSEYARRMGEAFYDGLSSALKKAMRGEGITSEFEILVRDPSIWDGIRGHMSKDVSLEILWKRNEGQRTRIRFLKRYKKTSRMLSSLAGGRAVAD